MSYTDAVKILEKKNKKFEYKVTVCSYSLRHVNHYNKSTDRWD